MSVYDRWRNRLSVRKRLLNSARSAEDEARTRWRRAKPGTHERSLAYRALKAAKAKTAKRLEQVQYAARVVSRYSPTNALYGGSRGVTNEVIRIVGDRAPITSRKRPASHPLSLANPGSDHNAANRTADAVDFGIANAYGLAREIAAKLGAPGQWSGDYDSFIIHRRGKRYRVQIIAGTHGTGPHLHVGVRRV